MQSEDTEIDSIGNATWRVAGSGPNSSPRSPPSGVALHLQWALPLGSVRIALISHWLVPIPRGCCSLPRRCRIGNPYSWLWVATPKDTRHALPLCRSSVRFATVSLGRSAVSSAAVPPGFSTANPESQVHKSDSAQVYEYMLIYM